jgi:hypothetical protein
MGTKSRDRLYGTSVRMAAERAAEARKEADKLACDAWNKRMLTFKGPAQPSPTLGDALPLPRLRYPSNRRARHRAAAEDDTDL